jgi:hypothetical protein
MNPTQIIGSTAALPKRYQEFLNLLSVTPSFSNQRNNQAKFGNLDLSFWYFNDPTLDHVLAYKNGIWINVSGHKYEEITIWIFVLINNNKGGDDNELGKKVSIFSSQNLELENFDQKLIPPMYCLPIYNQPNVSFPKKCQKKNFYESHDVEYISDPTFLKKVIDKLYAIAD